MGEILDLKTIHDYNAFLGLETLNPLVAFVDFSKVKVLKHRCKCFGFYVIFLKEKIHGTSLARKNSGFRQSHGALTSSISRPIISGTW